MLVKSDDDGKSWSSPINITHQVKNKDWRLFFNGPGKGITMSDGTLVFPAQFKDAYGMPFSTLIYSKDKGNSWYSGTGAKSNTTEAQIVELSDGSLMLNMRDNRGGSRSVAITSDLGKTWSEHASSRGSLIEPVCMASIINHPSQKNILFFSNPDSNQARENITIKASRDEGNYWPKEFQLLLDEGKGWGYSCLTVLNENELGILYESSVANMTYQIIPIADVLKEK
jgi:sialidase-1